MVQTQLCNRTYNIPLEKLGNYKIPFSYLELVDGWSGKTKVLALVDECFWKYSIKASTWNKAKLCLQYRSWVKVRDTIRAVIFRIIPER